MDRLFKPNADQKEQSVAFFSREMTKSSANTLLHCFELTVPHMSNSLSKEPKGITEYSAYALLHWNEQTKAKPVGDVPRLKPSGINTGKYIIL